MLGNKMSRKRGLYGTYYDADSKKKIPRQTLARRPDNDDIKEVSFN